jgi:hypothetical protein
MTYYQISDALVAAQDALDNLDLAISRTWADRLWVQHYRVRWFTPPILVSKTLEIDHPFRRARSVLIRISPTRALVFGFWGKTVYDEAQQLLEATILGRKRDRNERDAFDDTVIRDHSEALASTGNLSLRFGGYIRRAGAPVDARADVTVKPYHALTSGNMGRGFNDEDF